MTILYTLQKKFSDPCYIVSPFALQFSCSVASDALQPHGLQHARPPCPSPTPGVYSNSCPLSRWCHPTISSSVVPFSSCPQSFPASGSFQMIQLFASGGQSTGVSASKSVLPMNIQDWLPLGVYSSLCYKLEQNSLSASTVAWRLCVLTHPLGPWPVLCMQCPPWRPCPSAIPLMKVFFRVGRKCQRIHKPLPAALNQWCTGGAM